MNQVIKEDMAYISEVDFISWEKLDGSTVFVTGATGLIGFYLVSALLCRNKDIRVIALVRNVEAAKEKFHDFSKELDKNLYFLEGSMEELPAIPYGIDYIVHCASPTSSEDFALRPVETAVSLVQGCRNVLGLARDKRVSGVVYLSSMEVYGTGSKQEKIAENHAVYLDVMNPRNSYPFGKLLCENLCAAYAAEYGVPVKTVRLTQTFGPGVRPGDKRFFAYLLEKCRMQEDIVLLTEGRTKRSYLYLADAVTAILAVLLSGEPGNTYNAANESSYCSIRSLAELAAETLGQGKVKVKIKPSESSAKKFMGEHYMDLDTSKLRSLGWHPRYSLAEMLSRAMADQM